MAHSSRDTLKIRRGRRTDSLALQALLRPSTPVEMSKTEIRHWRRLAGDPALDFYVAEQAGTIRGIVLVCYVRELQRPGWQAILDVVVPASATCDIGQKLLDFAKARARKRGCQRMLVWMTDKGESQHVLFARGGFHRIGEVLSYSL